MAGVPRSHNSLNARLQFDDSHLGSFVERHDRNVQRVAEPGQAVCRVAVIERVKHLDWLRVNTGRCWYVRRLDKPRIIRRGTPSGPPASSSAAWSDGTSSPEPCSAVRGGSDMLSRARMILYADRKCWCRRERNKVRWWSEVLNRGWWLAGSDHRVRVPQRWARKKRRQKEAGSN
jgi:hypothetical protein